MWYRFSFCLIFCGTFSSIKFVSSSTSILSTKGKRGVIRWYLMFTPQRGGHYCEQCGKGPQLNMDIIYPTDWDESRGNFLHIIHRKATGDPAGRGNRPHVIVANDPTVQRVHEAICFFPRQVKISPFRCEFSKQMASCTEHRKIAIAIVAQPPPVVGGGCPVSFASVT